MVCIVDEGYLYIDPLFGDIASFFFALSAVIAFFANIFCLIVLWQPSQRSKAKKILTSLAVSDCLCGLNNIPAVIYMIHHGHIQHNIPCELRSFVAVISIWSTNCSVYSILLLTYDRYVLITKPIGYNEILSKRKINFIIIFFWALGLVGAITAVLYQPFYIVSASIFFVSTTIALIASYFLIWRAVRQGQKYITSTQTSTDTDHKNACLAKKVSIIIICYLVAITPTFIYILLSLGFRAFSNQVKSILYLFSLFTLFSNSAVNPFLYTWKDPEFRATCKRLLKKTKVTALFVKK